VNAAIYIRWSTEDQGSGTTLDVQRDSCLKYAVDNGWHVAPEHIFVEDGISGAKENRPALNRLTCAVQQGAVDTVIVYKLDRLARSPYVSYKLIEKDWHRKASLVSITEAHIDTTTTTGQLGFGIAAVFAAHERNTIRDRTMAGKRRRAEQGRNPGLRPPYGYTIVDKRFVIVDKEAATVQRVYEDYLAGKRDGEICRGLNDSGIRTREGKPWHISGVQRLLTNPAYMGQLVYRDIRTEGAFPVIIDDDRWNQVQALRLQRARAHPRRMGAESPYILSGRLWCATCGRPMNGRVSRNGKYENRYYACTGSIQFRDCRCLTVRQEQLEGAMVAHLLPLLDENELNLRITEQMGAALDLLKVEVSGLESRLTEIGQELARVRQDYRKNKIDADTFNGLRVEIEAEQKSLSNTLADKKMNLAKAESDAQVCGDLRKAVELIRVWQDLTLVQKKQVVHLLTERIEWDYRSQQLTMRTTV